MNSNLQINAELICHSPGESEERISDLQAQFPNVTAKDNDERLGLYI